MGDPTDEFAITSVLNRHQTLIDQADAEGYADLYSPDGVYRSPFATARGHDEIVEMFRGLQTSGFTKNKRHFAGQSVVQVEGDAATALSYWWVADYSGERPTVYATGTYEDDLAKIDGRWKITSRRQTMDAAAP